MKRFLFSALSQVHARRRASVIADSSTSDHRQSQRRGPTPQRLNVREPGMEGDADATHSSATRRSIAGARHGRTCATSRGWESLAGAASAATPSTDEMRGPAGNRAGTTALAAALGRAGFRAMRASRPCSSTSSCGRSTSSRRTARLAPARPSAQTAPTTAQAEAALLRSASRAHVPAAHVPAAHVPECAMRYA